MKVTVIGAGAVGATCADNIARAGVCTDLVLLDIKEGLAEGKAQDMQQTAALLGFDTIITGSTNDYSKTANSDVVVITSGIPRKPGMTREELIGTNAGIVKGVCENVLKYSSFKTGMLTLQHSTEWNLMAISLAVAITSILIARYLYVKRAIVPPQDDVKLTFMYKLSQNKFYVDELYDTLIVKPLNWLSIRFYQNIEVAGIDKAVDSTGGGVKVLSAFVRLLQNGQLTFYVFAMVIGMLLILASKFL